MVVRHKQLTPQQLLATGEVAEVLEIATMSASRLIKEGRLPAVKVGRFYVVPRVAVEKFAETYQPKVGRPRVKRKYTKRSPRWF